MRAQNEVMVRKHDYICPGSDKQLMSQKNGVCIGTKDEKQYGAQQGCTSFPKSWSHFKILYTRKVT